MANNCLNTACGTIPTKPIMTLIDQCFTVSDCDTTTAQFCLDEFAYPVDGYRCYNLEIPKSCEGCLDESITLFDNEIEIASPSEDLSKEKLYARGLLLYIDYQFEDSNGEEVPLKAKKAWITITNANNEECTYPMYNFFSIFTNPETVDPSDFINKIKVTNPSDKYSFDVRALVILTKSATI
jgi:hypothetical protein